MVVKIDTKWNLCYPYMDRKTLLKRLNILIQRYPDFTYICFSRNSIDVEVPGTPLPINQMYSHEDRLQYKKIKVEV